MRRLGVLLAAVVCAAQAPAISGERLRTAAQKSVALLQESGKVFYQTQLCFSCHHQGLPMQAFQVGRQRGIPLDEAGARDLTWRAFSGQPAMKLASIDTAVQYNYIIDPAMDTGSELVAAHAAGVAPSLTTAIYARRLANWQRADGHWFTTDSRPPQAHSMFTATAVSLRAVQLYMPQELAAERDQRVRRAAAWLAANTPRATEDHAYRLLGLGWADAQDAARGAARALLAEQKPDGGWAQLASRASDAYATGQAIVALLEAGGHAAGEPAIQRGLKYLLDTQQADGSWQVATRLVSPAPLSPPYFESGFPHGKDQFISAAGTSWAAMALMLALPKVVAPAQPLPVKELLPRGEKPWMRPALFGAAEELKRLLDAGLNSNSATAEGTTLLMMAAPDAAKTRLLVERGARVQAKAKSGFTALMVASLYQGSNPSVRLLLEKGDARFAKGVKFNASPLALAAFAGDLANVSTLAAHGADPRRRMAIIGTVDATPLNIAAATGEVEMVKLLIRLGADPHAVDRDGMNLLSWMTIANNVAVARTLIEAGVRVNQADRYGFTPLLYAASTDFGDTAMLELLLQSGADPKVTTKDGVTALGQTKRWNYPQLRRVLEQAGAGQ